jgi:uncharacterized protein YbjT (DUF2867 family)
MSTILAGLPAGAPVLVVGATGHLGGRVVARLAAAGQPVRALARPGARSSHLQALPGVEIVSGELGDAASLERACRGAAALVATASSVVPRLAGDGFAALEGRGYPALWQAARRQGVGRVVLVSVPQTRRDAQVPLFAWKRRVEAALAEAGPPACVLRPAPFMDEWFLLVGLALAARGEPAPLSSRPWPFLQRFLGLVGGLVERRGLALVPGSPRQRHAFIAVEDVAAFVLAALARGGSGQEVFEIGGPQALSWEEVAAQFAAVLGRPVRALGAPAALFRAQQLLLRPFAPAAANIMALNWLAASEPMLAPGGAEAARLLGVTPRSVADFLREKKAQGPAC